MLNILIVEDDPMVAQINRQFIEKVDPEALVDFAQNVTEAMEIIQSKTIDLLLLDIYICQKKMD